MLWKFAAVLGDVLLGCELVARYGGEEFCALIERDSEALVRQEALALCERVRAHPFQAENLRIPLTVSIGVAQGREAARAEDPFAQADRPAVPDTHLALPDSLTALSSVGSA